MIELLPLNDEIQITDYFKKAGMEADEHSGCLVAKNGQDVLGFCLYRLYEKGITILHITPDDDLALADGILRSALNVAAQRSAMDARYEGENNEELLDKLGFILDKGSKRLDIDKLFRGCGCKT